MNLLWGGLMILAGLLLLIGGTLKSDFILYRLLVARSKILWGEKVYIFHQISGVIIVVIGILMTLGYI